MIKYIQFHDLKKNQVHRSVQKLLIYETTDSNKIKLNLKSVYMSQPLLKTNSILKD